MTNAYFHPLSVTSGSATYRADVATGGPWAQHLQHGGPPNALQVLAAETLAADETGRSDLVAMRLSADFVGPVPVADVQVNARIVRAARSAVLVETSLASQDRECLRGRVWLVRSLDTESVAPSPELIEVPVAPTGMGSGVPYLDSIEWRTLSGGLSEVGPGVSWARPTMQIVDDVPTTGLQRAALIGDSASGLSSALDWQVWSFLNVDLDVHLARRMHGEWLRMDAITDIGPEGSGLARSVLSDVQGVLGTTSQTLVVEPIRH